LSDTCLESQYCDALAARVVGKVVQHEFGKTQTAKLRANVHSFDLAVVTAKQLNAAATNRDSVVTDDEERHILV
jgi:hypothetical protein